MAETADYGLMLWDGKSKGTVNNVVNLSRDHKPVVVYVAPTKTRTPGELVTDSVSRASADSILQRRQKPVEADGVVEPSRTFEPTDALSLVPLGFRRLSRLVTRPLRARTPTPRG
jgi:hypothetical protein